MNHDKGEWKGNVFAIILCILIGITLVIVRVELNNPSLPMENQDEKITINFSQDDIKINQEKWEIYRDASKYLYKITQELNIPISIDIATGTMTYVKYNNDYGAISPEQLIKEIAEEPYISDDPTKNCQGKSTRFINELNIPTENKTFIFDPTHVYVIYKDEHGYHYTTDPTTGGHRQSTTLEISRFSTELTYRNE